MENVIVTGASGFIGSNICETLKDKYNVYKLSREFLYNPDFSKEFIKKTKADYIIHCAAYGNMSDQDNNVHIMQANIANIFNLLTVSGGRLKGFVNFSSSSVTLTYTTMYSATKRAGEEICKAFVNMYDMPIVSVRPYTITGPGEQSAHFIPTLIHSALLKKQMPYVGYPTHDYVDVRDVVSAIELLLPQCNKLKGQVIDIASGSAISNDGVRFIVEDLIKTKIPVKHVKNMRAYDVQNWHGNPMILDGLGWKRKYRLRDSIKDMIDYESIRKN